MIYLPWIVFLAAVLWMIRQGDKAKREYRRRKAEQEQRKSSAESNVEALSPRGGGQGQAPELTGALAGKSHGRIAGFGQQRPS
jgi:hypothetical protein